MSENLLQSILLLRELELQVVELLDDAGVVRVGEHVRRARHQRDRADDPVRLVLRLLEHALDLTADAFRDRPVQRRAARYAAVIADGVTAVLEAIEIVERVLELGQQERRRGRAIARQTLEVSVQLGFEARRVLAVGAALFDSIAQRREEPPEIGRTLLGRGRGCSSATPPNVPWDVPPGADQLRVERRGRPRNSNHPGSEPKHPPTRHRTRRPGRCVRARNSRSP